MIKDRVKLGQSKTKQKKNIPLSCCLIFGIVQLRIIYTSCVSLQNAMIVTVAVRLLATLGNATLMWLALIVFDCSKHLVQLQQMLLSHGFIE